MEILDKKDYYILIIQTHMGENMEHLPKTYSSYSEIYGKCHELTETYKGKTIQELMDLLNIDEKKINKAIGEKIFVKMFSGNSNSIQKSIFFNKFGIICKTLTLTEKGLRKEDMKLFSIDFNEFNENIVFENSQSFYYFTNHRFLCIIFQKPYKDAPMIENKFLGFKIIDFDKEFIEKDVRKTWERIKDLIVNNKLMDVVSLDKYGQPRINKSGNVISAPNFPKSSEGNVFVRGTSSTSDVKPLNINGVRMYYQQMWIKGLYVVEKLECEDYL